MIRKNKLLICTLAMSVVLTLLPGMTSSAAEADGETQAAASELRDANSQRLEEVTAMGEDGEIYEIGSSDGTVAEEETDGIAMFSARSVETKVVNFNTGKSGTTEYYDETNKGDGYTYGAYGADAAYLGTTSDGKIRFMLAGVTGTVDESEVQLLDFDSVADNVSYYKVSDGKLMHHISQNLNKAQSSKLNNGPAPSYLEEGVKYYSYDGRYFYTEYETMLADYQKGERSNAVNPSDKFTNFFQFYDMTDSTNYTGDELDEILETAMANAGKDPEKSMLTGTGNIFVKYQDIYHVNALLSIGIAVNESGWGTSNICTTKNNLFGLNAVDSNVGNANAYNSVEDCIYDFMKNWMAEGFLKEGKWKNNGEYLGNKGGGINVQYASDPYWGEKAAAIAWTLDAAGGNKDLYDIKDTDSGDKTENGSQFPSETPGNDTNTSGTDTKPGNDTNTPGTDTKPGNDTNTPGTDTKPGNDINTPGSDNTTGEDDNSGKEPAQDVEEDTSDVEEESGQEPAPVPDDSAQGEDDNTPASEKTPDTDTPSKTEEVKTISDTGKKVTIAGNLSADADVTVDEIKPNTEKYNSYVSADEIKGKTVLGVYDITLTGDMKGQVKLTFHVNAEYDGKNVVILHYLKDGKYETYRGKVEDGQITISVNGFSPYVIALDDNGSHTDTTPKSPKTGDYSDNAAAWAVLAGMSVVFGITALVLKRRVKQ